MIKIFTFYLYFLKNVKSHTHIFLCVWDFTFFLKMIQISLKIFFLLIYRRNYALHFSSFYVKKWDF